MVGLAALMILSSSQAFTAAESCKITYLGRPDQFRFVRVYEEPSGRVAMFTAMKGGDTKSVYVEDPRIRIETKYAGDIDYRPGPIADCAKGNVVRF